MISSENIPPLTKLYPKVCNCVIMWSCTSPLELTEEIKEYMVVRNFQYETYILCNKGFCEKLGWISWSKKVLLMQGTPLRNELLCQIFAS